MKRAVRIGTGIAEVGLRVGGRVRAGTRVGESHLRRGQECHAWEVSLQERHRWVRNVETF